MTRAASLEIAAHVESALGFLEALRTQGHAIGVDQFVAVEHLVFALHDRGVLPEDPADLADFIGPVVCGTPEEQREFASRHATWIRDRRAGSATPPAPVEAEVRKLRHRVGWWRAALTLIASLWVLAMVALLYHLQTSEAPEMPAAAPVEEPDPTPSELPPAELPALPAAADQPRSPPETPTERDPRTFLLLLLFGGGGALAALVIAYAVWWRRRAGRFLARGDSAEPPDTRHLFVARTPEGLYAGGGMSRIAQRLRTWRHIQVPHLDVDATVDASVRRGGWFTPVRAHRLAVPEFLCLVDRASLHDHHAKLVEAFIARLRREGLHVQIYSFHRDPRVCFPADPDTPPTSLRRLAGRHPEHRLWLFTDGDGLFDPIRGQPADWLDVFEAWSERSVVTFARPSTWGAREAALVGRGFHVLPGSIEGFEASVEGTLEDLLARALLEPTSALFPHALETDPRLWLDPDAPEEERLEEALAEVRAYLGADGYDWLCALAVYPEIRWELTLFLGHNLRTQDGGAMATEERLADLARLPWLRTGHMPPWLRRRLLRDLEGEREREVRALLRDLLLTSVEGPRRELTLDVALPQRSSTIRRLWRDVVRRWRREVGDAHPIHDAVFLSWMDDRLAVRVPRAVMRTLGGLRTTVPRVRTGPGDLDVAPVRQRVLQRVGHAAGVVLGLVLLLAAVSKLLDPALFTDWIEAEGLDVLVPAGLIAPLAIAIEAALGMALLCGLRLRWNLVPTSLVVALMLFLNGRTYVHHVSGTAAPSDGCGCFGRLWMDRAPPEAFWLGLFLLVPLLLVAVLLPRARRYGPVTRRAVAVGVVFVVTLVLVPITPSLPLDDAVTELRPGVRVDELCADGRPERICVVQLMPELASGRHLVVMTDLDDPTLLASIDTLGGPNLERVEQVRLLTSATREDALEFEFRQMALLPVTRAPLELLRPLYRRLPRSFAVRDGVVTETFDGLPPTSRLEVPPEPVAIRGEPPPVPPPVQESLQDGIKAREQLLSRLEAEQAALVSVDPRPLPQSIERLQTAVEVFPDATPQAGGSIYDLVRRIREDLASAKSALAKISATPDTAEAESMRAEAVRALQTSTRTWPLPDLAAQHKSAERLVRTYSQLLEEVQALGLTEDQLGRQRVKILATGDHHGAYSHSAVLALSRQQEGRAFTQDVRNCVMQLLSVLKPDGFYPMALLTRYLTQFPQDAHLEFALAKLQGREPRVEPKPAPDEPTPPVKGPSKPDEPMKPGTEKPRPDKPTDDAPQPKEPTPVIGPPVKPDRPTPTGVVDPSKDRPSPAQHEGPEDDDSPGPDDDSPGPPAPPAPFTSDALRVQLGDVAPSGDAWKVGDRVTWEAVVANEGAVATPQIYVTWSFPPGIQAGNTPESWRSSAFSLAPGESRTVRETTQIVSLPGTSTTTAFVHRATSGERLAEASLVTVFGTAPGKEPHPQFRDFVPTGTYVLLLQGDIVSEARIFHSKRAAAYLVLNFGQPAGLLILLRSRTVTKVPLQDIVQGSGGGIDLKGGPWEELGPYRFEGKDVAFDVDGLEGRLKAKPHLEGLHDADGVLRHTPEFGQVTYELDSKSVAKLRKRKGSHRVVVYFGTWCSFCKRFMISVFELDRALKGSGFEFAYFALPPPPAAWMVKEATQLRIRKLPTAIVMVDGRQVGRLEGNDFIKFEVSLARVLR